MSRRLNDRIKPASSFKLCRYCRRIMGMGAKNGICQICWNEAASRIAFAAARANNG